MIWEERIIIIDGQSRLEVTMAKGQKRSGREPKKPKKTESKRLSGGGVGSVFAQAPGVTAKHH